MNTVHQQTVRGVLRTAHCTRQCALPLFAMCSRLFMLCVRMYAVCRSHLCIVNVREYEVQDTFPLHLATVLLLLENGSFGLVFTVITQRVSPCCSACECIGSPRADSNYCNFGDLRWCLIGLHFCLRLVSLEFHHFWCQTEQSQNCRF